MNVDGPASASRFHDGHDGLRLHYRVFDGPVAAPVVICLPGLTRNGRDFAALARHLAPRYRVLCPDFRGRGASAYAADPRGYVPNSYVRDLAALFDAEALDQAVLIGTSLGGLVATVFAALIPGRVAAVVLNDVGPEVDPVGLARIGGYVGQSRPIASWSDAADAVAAIDAATYPGFGAADWLRLARQRYVEEPDGTIRLDYDLAISRPFASGETNPDLWPFFRRLRLMPTLVLRGGHSDILSRATVAGMKAAVPRLVAVEFRIADMCRRLTSPKPSRRSIVSLRGCRRVSAPSIGSAA